jgi:hypothetical protein
VKLDALSRNRESIVGELPGIETPVEACFAGTFEAASGPVSAVCLDLIVARPEEGVSRYIEDPLQEKGGLTSWDLSFAEYIEEHKNSKLLFCWYARGVGVVFSPADHHGIWAAQREGTLSKGLVPDHLVTFLEALAKSKGLV